MMNLVLESLDRHGNIVEAWVWPLMVGRARPLQDSVV